MAQVRIDAAVGIRDGRSTMPNLARDLNQVTALFDRIPVAQGGSMEIGGLWPTDRNALILELTAQIIRFQTTNRRPRIDGVIDPDGGTLRLMNQLAREPGRPSVVTGGATVMPNPGGKPDKVEAGAIVAEPQSVGGTGKLRAMTVATNYIRKLVRHESSSIQWFGVVIPTAANLSASLTPHLNFTPSPWQGGYLDPGYDEFSSWAQLWDDYTSVIGGQMAAARADQILVLPFYRNSQAKDLGSFLLQWKKVVDDVITAVIQQLDPLALRDTFFSSSIVSSSFSNGWIPHQNFQTQAIGAAALSERILDLDGVAGGSMWVPPKSIIYRNRALPRGMNPQGNIYYVGGRWDAFAKFYGGGFNTHACCRNHLLYPGLRL
ncbi:hypothetical protein [Bryobacter aggregatus]|uniref:hypothetical protein n=1 Tax=Bryobacter aggregatus TaxID=360054 RepID=UPI0004E22DBF|nr:hypothetical protein [Bryobacter aggregatus]